MIDFLTKNVLRDHFMPENVFKMKIIQKASLKNQNSKWCQFLKKAQNGHFKGLGVPKIYFCPIFKIKSFICYGGMHQNSEMACGVGGMAFGRSECVPRSGPQMVKKCIP